ncbi:unnamed protein product [Arctogadus glacialis]
MMGVLKISLIGHRKRILASLGDRLHEDTPQKPPRAISLRLEARAVCWLLPLGDPWALDPRPAQLSADSAGAAGVNRVRSQQHGAELQTAVEEGAEEVSKEQRSKASDLPAGARTRAGGGCVW